MMKMYFSPDVSQLREVPRAQAEPLLELASEERELPPDTMLVDNLLQMIQVAREAFPNGIPARV